MTKILGVHIKKAILRAAGNAGQTVGLANVPFIASEDTFSSWNGTAWTAPFDCTITGDAMITITPGAAWGISLYIDGVQIERLTETYDLNQSTKGGSFSSKILQGQVVSIRSVNNGGVITNTPLTHYLNIIATPF